MIKLFPDTNTLRAQSPELLQFCQELPERFDHLGSVIFASRNTIRRCEVGGTTLIVKRYKRPNLLASMGYALRRTSKARKAYYNGLELLVRGFRTPHPYAAVEVWGEGGLRLHECYYICGECMATLDLAQTLNEAPTPDAVVAERFGRYVAALHDQGVMMIDLNSTNVLFEPADLEGDDPKKWFQLIDINRMKFVQVGRGKSFSLNARLENLTRFTGRLEVFELVARHYLAALGLDKDNFQQFAKRVKEKHDERWRLRKRVCHPIRNRNYGK